MRSASLDGLYDEVSPSSANVQDKTTGEMMKTRGIGRNQKGQAMVEFVIVAPILLLLVFGIIQFGIIFNNKVALTMPSRAGARQAAVSRTLSDPEGVATTIGSSSAAGHLKEE